MFKLQQFCTDQYKNSVINSYINRAYKISSSWQDFDTELNHVRQTLINNNYPNSVVDKHINKFLNNMTSPSNPNNKFNAINIYYKSQMHSNYKIDERMIKSIILENTKPIAPDNKIKPIIYYSNRKTCNLVMRNDTNPIILQTL